MKSCKILLVIIGALVAAGSLSAQQRTDAAVRADLERRIQPGIRPGTNITVSVQNGVVTIAGTVQNYSRKLNILDLARRTVGVREVIDRITVTPAQPRTDQQILDSVRQALTGNLSREELAAVNIRVQNGVVILTGTLPSSYPKQIAGLLSGWVTGVVGVRNEIVVRPTQARSDLQIASDVNARFQRNPFINDLKISVSVSNGVVMLTGIVDNFLESEQAESIARFTPGVVDVRNLLFVRAEGR